MTQVCSIGRERKLKGTIVLILETEKQEKKINGTKL